LASLGARWVLYKGPGQGQTRLRGRDPRVLKRVLLTRKDVRLVRPSCYPAVRTTTVFFANTTHHKEGTVQISSAKLAHSVQGISQRSAQRQTELAGRPSLFAVVPLEPGKPILAKISTRNLFSRTLTEPHAPQMTWLWNWSH